MSGNAEALIRRVLFLIMTLTALAGCGPSAPDALGAATFIKRALTQEQQGITVRASVLTDDESRRYFGGSTADADAQAVWIQFENDTDEPTLFIPILTDPTYFAPQEVAQRLHGWLSVERMPWWMRHFKAISCPITWRHTAPRPDSFTPTRMGA